MSKIKIGTVKENSISAYLDNLTYNSEQYDALEIEIFLGSTFISTSAVAPLVGTKRTSTTTFFGLDCGTTYNFKGWARWDGTWYSHGTISQSTEDCGQRPPNFSWTFSKNSGGNFNLKAYEWNGLVNNIRDVRDFYNYPTIFMNTVSSGDDFLAIYFNNVVSALSGINYSTSPPGYKSSGDTIRAADLNRLVDCINSVNS